MKVFAELESDASGMEPDGVALNLLAYVLVKCAPAAIAPLLQPPHVLLTEATTA